MRSRARRRELDRKFKKKRSNYSGGHKCSNAKCGICSYHKRLSNSKGRFKHRDYREMLKK